MLQGLQQHAKIAVLASVPTLSLATIVLADTSVTDEDILNISGQASELPDPTIFISFAAFLLIGVGVLQFSLGDLTKEVHSHVLH